MIDDDKLINAHITSTIFRMSQISVNLITIMYIRSFCSDNMINFKFKHRVIKDSVIDTVSFAQKVFELYVLNRATRIKLAIDTGGINITPDFSDMVIYLRKETFYNGPVEILANGTKYIGTWSSNYDYSFLDLSIEGLPQFKYFEKTWRFKYKSLDLLILVPRSNPLKKEMHLEHL